MVPNASDRDAYFAEVRRLLQAALLVPPGMPARLNATVQFFLAADGTLSRAKMVSPSGNAVFDRAVLEAIARTRAPARPDGTGELMETTLATRAER
jgi:TonB family protein